MQVMENPTMLYQHPGPHDIHGGKYDYTIVEDAEVEAKLAEGWFRSTVEALEAWTKAEEEKAKSELEKVEEQAAVTRDEAIQKLEELGVTFDRRLGITKLLNLIEETVKGRTDSNPAQG